MNTVTLVIAPSVTVFMESADRFMPTAGVVGFLPIVTYFLLIVTTYAFLGTFIFGLVTRRSVSPEHRSSQTLTAMIAAVAGLSYYLIQSHYRDMLTELATLTDALDRQTLIRESYNAIGQYRYMDWAITTPLLLIKMVSMLRIKPAAARRPLVILLTADFLMILTGYIGEQQLSFDNEIRIAPKLIWGAISTVGYLAIPVVLFRLWKQHGSFVQPEEQNGYRLMALTTVTFWYIYPLGYILTVLDIDTNWIHIAFSLADMINKIGVGVVAYQAGKQVLERRMPPEAVAAVHKVG